LLLKAPFRRWGEGIPVQGLENSRVRLAISYAQSSNFQLKNRDGHSHWFPALTTLYGNIDVILMSSK
jgi:hypothetical protein